MPVKGKPDDPPFVDRVVVAMNRLAEVMERDIEMRQRELDEKRDILRKVDVDDQQGHAFTVDSYTGKIIKGDK